jgi:hypothetical protein
MTRKLKSTGLLLGTDSPDKISAKTFLAGFVPDNFVPVAVNGEGTEKVSAYLKGIDAQLANVVAGVVSYTDQLFTISSPASRVTLSTNLSATNLVDVMVNGVMYDEGTNWERDTATDEIVWLGTDGSLTEQDWPAGTRIRVRQVSSSTTYTDEFFDGSSQTLEVGTTIGEASRIDVYFNGVMKEEGQDWTRDTVQNDIELVSNSYDVGTSIRVRIWT